jgi:hypothetical protein
LLIVFNGLSQEIEGKWYLCKNNGEYVEYIIGDGALLTQENNYTTKSVYNIKNDTLYYRFSHSGINDIDGIFLFEFSNDSTVLIDNYYLSEWNRYELNFADTLKHINNNYLQKNCLDLRTNKERKYDSLQEVRIKELEQRLLELVGKEDSLNNKKKN